jgi:hypothetical protein
VEAEALNSSLGACMDCPNCHLANPEIAEHCDCGYDFKAGRLDLVAAPESPRITPTNKLTSGQIGCVVLIVLAAIIGIIYVTSPQNQNQFETREAVIPGPVQPAAPSETILELIDWHWREEYGYARLDGQVKNISTERMENVMAVAVFKTKSGDLIISSDALINYNPIMPGQTSPFSVMARWNPEMDGASLDFRQLMGGAINWRNAKK